jgi:hypothetical protein
VLLPTAVSPAGTSELQLLLLLPLLAQLAHSACVRIGELLHCKLMLKAHAPVGNGGRQQRPVAWPCCACVRLGAFLRCKLLLRVPAADGGQQQQQQLLQPCRCARVCLGALLCCKPILWAPAAHGSQ